MRLDSWRIPDRWNLRRILRDWLLKPTCHEEQARDASVARAAERLARQRAERRAKVILATPDGREVLAQKEADWGLNPSGEVVRFTEEFVRQVQARVSAKPGDCR